MEVGLVDKIDIDSEMQQAYLDYAMSVIVSRALPDARDGLKPVHRRILYAMHDMGIRADTPYKKSARIVGEVLGKYHPHGDAAVYDAMARMAQDFSMRYLLVNGQGNFGSVDGDPPAAMRYTEARLTTAAVQMLADIQKNTVDFVDNFDGSLLQPTVLPAALPNLLINGATGIAVGMATSIPPHNLNEIVDAMQFVLSNWERLDDIGVEELLQFVKGPDFPTGGLLVTAAGADGLVSAYSTGRGQVTIQARTHLEEMERGRSRIIVSELPYMTNKSSLIERIADLVREEKLEGIADLRDESDRQGMRIVIELSKTAEPEKVLHNLLRHTPMQTTFSIILLALVDGEPRMLSLKQAMRVYLEHRLEIVRRRSQYDLERARARAHILEGLRVALKNLDEVIEIIRKSPDADVARTRLMKRFKLTDIQTQAILDMPLRRLAALERKKIEEEYKEIQALIKELEVLLRSPKKMRQVVGDELNHNKEIFGDPRRTHIVKLKEGQTTASLLTAAETVPDKPAWLCITADGLIARTMTDALPALSGREAPAWLVRIGSRDTLYLVAESGEAAALPVHAVPEADNPLDGAPLIKISALREGKPLAAVFSVPSGAGRGEAAEGEPAFILTVSRQGMLKKSALSELPGPSANLFPLTRVNPGDRLGWAAISTGKNELLLLTASGMAIRFREDEVRPMGLAAAGVMGIKLNPSDDLAGVELLPQAGEVLLVTDSGRAKRVPTDQFPLQGRYGQGVQAWKLNSNERLIGSAIGKGTTRVAAHSSRLLPKPIRMDDAPLQNRAARGAILQELKTGDLLTRLTAPIVPLHLKVETATKAEIDSSRRKTPDRGKSMATQNTPDKTSAGKPASQRRATATAERPSGKTAAPAVKPAPKTTAPKKSSTSRSVQVPAATVGKPPAKATSVKKPMPSAGAKIPAGPPAGSAVDKAAKTGSQAASNKTARAEQPVAAPGGVKAVKTPAKTESKAATPKKPVAKTAPPPKADAKTGRSPASPKIVSKTPSKAKAPAPTGAGGSRSKSAGKSAVKPPASQSKTTVTKPDKSTAGEPSTAAKTTTKRSPKGPTEKPAGKTSPTPLAASKIPTPSQKKGKGSSVPISPVKPGEKKTGKVKSPGASTTKTPAQLPLLPIIPPKPKK